MSTHSTFTSIWSRRFLPNVRRPVPLSPESVIWALLRVSIAFTLATWACAAQPPAESAILEIAANAKVGAQDYLTNWVVIESVFNDLPAKEEGKDPFFPKSERVLGLQTKGDLTEVALPELVLKGISVSRSRRLAIVNNYTLGEGETRKLRVNNRVFEVRCVEVRDTSIVINYRGQDRELFLRPGL